MDCFVVRCLRYLLVMHELRTYQIVCVIGWILPSRFIVSYHIVYVKVNACKCCGYVLSTLTNFSFVLLD